MQRSNKLIAIEVNGDNIIGIDTLDILESFKYKNWYNDNEEYRILYAHVNENKLYNTIKDIVLDTNEYKRSQEDKIVAAVGSIEFTEYYLGKRIRAINIPKDLRSTEYTQRYVDSIDKSDLDRIAYVYGKLFIKGDTWCKEVEPIIYNYNSKNKEGLKGSLPNKLFISEIVDIESEYRAFIYRGEIIDCRQYIGDYRDRFDIDILQHMINKWKDKPTAFTLDIGVLKTGETVIIEAHNFLSCGTYGFNDPRKLANMVLAAYREEQKSRMVGDDIEEKS